MFQMVRYVHKQCQSSGWLSTHESPDPSVLGVVIRLANSQHVVHPPDISPTTIEAIEGIDAAVGFTMSSEITAALFRQMSPYQTEIMVHAHGLKIPIVESFEDVVHLANSTNGIRGSACIMRKEKVILVWSNTVQNLLPHGAEIEKLLVDTVSDCPEHTWP
jgi:hypothetical protein